MTDEPPTHPTGPDTPEGDPPEPAAPESDPGDAFVAVDPLDARLSAALDGESVPESIDADNDDTSNEGTAHRRRALAQARDLLAVPPPPLDDITRRRLLRAAVVEAPRGKARDVRRLNRLGAAAAVLAVVVAGGLAIKALGSNSENGSKASGKGAGGNATALTTAPGAGPRARPLDLHDVSDPAVLKQRVTAALGGAAQFGATGDSTSPSSTAQKSPRAPDSDSVARCLPTITVAKGATPARALADATYNGTPAVVATASSTSGTAVYVVARSDCRLLTYQFLRR
jgi:hypothetical protein